MMRIQFSPRNASFSLKKREMKGLNCNTNTSFFLGKLYIPKKSQDMDLKVFSFSSIGEKLSSVSTVRCAESSTAVYKVLAESSTAVYIILSLLFESYFKLMKDELQYCPNLSLVYLALLYTLKSCSSIKPQLPPHN